jgi:hypothetical protein
MRMFFLNPFWRGKWTKFKIMSWVKLSFGPKPLYKIVACNTQVASVHELTLRESAELASVAARPSGPVQRELVFNLASHERTSSNFNLLASLEEATGIRIAIVFQSWARDSSTCIDLSLVIYCRLETREVKSQLLMPRSGNTPSYAMFFPHRFCMDVVQPVHR